MYQVSVVLSYSISTLCKYLAIFCPVFFIKLVSLLQLRLYHICDSGFVCFLYHALWLLSLFASLQFCRFFPLTMVLSNSINTFGDGNNYSSCYCTITYRSSNTTRFCQTKLINYTKY